MRENVRKVSAEVLYTHSVVWTRAFHSISSSAASIRNTTRYIVPRAASVSVVQRFFSAESAAVEIGFSCISCLESFWRGH